MLETWRMPAVPEEAHPFALADGWPDPLSGGLVTFRETGITLGSLVLEDEEWLALRCAPVLSLRVDDHPSTYGWTIQHPDGTESCFEFEIPTNPVLVPLSALADGRAFSEWVMDTHGALGRLLIWDESLRWWMVQDPDLELVITCAPEGIFAEKSEELSWLSIGSAVGRREVEQLRTRYGVTWDE
jgi:hypothetical protein